MREPIGVESAVAAGFARRRWMAMEAPLRPACETRIAVADGELLGRTALGYAGVERSLRRGLTPLSARELLAGIHRRGTADWAVKAGTLLDPRISRRFQPAVRRRLYRRIGPLVAALKARRHGLQGYLAAVVLGRIGEFMPGVEPAAFVQQVEAGSIDEPLLRAHLEFGAHPVAVVDDIDPPAAVVCWKAD